MKYTVISGDFRISLEGDTPRHAEEQALTLWRHKNEKPALSKILTVVKPDSKTVYLGTQEVLATSS